MKLRLKGHVKQDKKKGTDDESSLSPSSSQRSLNTEVSPTSERPRASPKFDETFLASRKIVKSFQELITDQSEGRLNSESSERTENKPANKTDYLTLVKSLRNKPQANRFSGSVVGNRLRMPQGEEHESEAPKPSVVIEEVSDIYPEEEQLSLPYYLPLWYIP